MAFINVVGDRQLSYTSLLQPGVLPPVIGSFTFNTLNTISFDVGAIVPNTAKQLNVTVNIDCGYAGVASKFNVWLWTELDNGQQDVKFKQGSRYPQNAISNDSETFSFAYSSKSPKLFLKSDYDQNQNLSINLFAVGYAQ
ncbi:unnamed protein product [Adineta steineri]|uniref:Uncharacterized protein n=1 Tax=Adineta steineri TaxID=433720 RepID=A0A819RH75_9BILA|nr:unnamed protein product [Adineta steineri]CAF4040650.1 unnamed protein product [Adineta steineri]